MNVQSNKYTFLYSSAMVVIVAALLSFAAVKLQPVQQKNIEIEKKQNILASVGIKSSPKDADELYDQYIKKSIVINALGDEIKEIDAFGINLKDEIRKAEKDRLLPVYECVKNDTFYIFPLMGKGLWGPIWGYISLEKDLNTIYGAIFDHKAETPGLGAEISTDWFQAPFKTKKIFNQKGEFVSIKVVKGGSIEKSNPHEVDGISGGTITSKGLENMVRDCLNPYLTYIKTHSK